MPQVINTNVLSLNAQRNLTTSQSSLATALQRLSSGLRINSAKDDAAGLAISDRFTTQIRGLNQAVRNANDGISLSQTAESALGELTNNLQRIREIAVQAANASNSASDRSALDLEVQQRLAEIERIATQTSFNNQKVLDGTFGSAVFQVGANVGETISIALNTSMRTSVIGSFVNASSDVSTQTSGTVATTGTGWDTGAYQAGAATHTGVSATAIDGSNALTINGTSVRASADFAVTGDTRRGADSAYAKAAAINASGIAGVTASATNVQTFDDDAVAADTFVSVAAVTGDSVNYSLSINGRAIFTNTTVANNGAGTISIDAAIAAINTEQFNTGVIASKNTNGQLVLTAADGRNIDVTESFTFADGTIANGSDNVAVESVFSSAAINESAADDSGAITQNLTFRGQLTLQSSTDITINQGQALIGFSSGTLTAASSLSAQNVTSVTNATNAILAVDSALTTVSNLRSTFGAIQNRFESTIASLSAVAENLEASRSRVLDADFAAETAALTRAQILQQAGVAILAQANTAPQSVLALLQ